MKKVFMDRKEELIRNLKLDIAVILTEYQKLGVTDIVQAKILTSLGIAIVLFYEKDNSLNEHIEKCIQEARLALGKYKEKKA